jgi:hypothetical protein
MTWEQHLDEVDTFEALYKNMIIAGHQVVKCNGVTGTNVNIRAGITGQPTNVFLIKGTASPTVVPTNPNWRP